jgi:hypothetical protein
VSPSFQNGCGESPCSESSVAPLIILASAACQKNRVSKAWNRLALGSSPGSRSATKGPSGQPAAILLAKHPEKWCGLIEAPAIDMLGCCMAGLVSKQLMKATHSGCMDGRSGSAVSSCFLLHPLRQLLSDDQRKTIHAAKRHADRKQYQLSERGLAGTCCAVSTASDSIVTAIVSRIPPMTGRM